MSDTQVQRPLHWSYLVPMVVAASVYSIHLGALLPLSVFLVGLLGCSLAYAVISRFGVGFELQAPARMREGDAVELVLLLSTVSWLPKFVAQAVAEVEYPSTEKEARQGRVSRSHNFFHTKSTPGGRGELYEMEGFILKLGHCRVQRRLEMERRGKVVIRWIRLHFTGPLGVFTAPRTFRVERTILVRVKPTRGADQLQLSGASGRLETQMKVGDTGDMTEYAGTRPYRTGDELRHIHWPTVARTGELFVREYTRSSAESVVVLLLRNGDLNREEDWGRPAAGEFLLRNLAALVIELYDRRIHTVFGSNVGEGHALSIGYSQRQLLEFHDEVSAVNWASPAGTVEFLDHLDVASLEDPAVVVFAVDRPNVRLLAGLPRALRVNPGRVMVVMAASASEPLQVPRGMRLIHCEESAPDGLFRKLVL